MSLGCLARGTCTDRDDDCVATDDADCASSTACRKEGACRAIDGVCRAASHADCRGAQICADDGSCYFNALDGECDDGTEQRSPVALKLGIAALVVGGASGLAVGYPMLMSQLPNHGLDSPVAHAAVACIAVGGAMVLGGVALVAYGTNRKRRPDAEVAVGPGQAHLIWRF